MSNRPANIPGDKSRLVLFVGLAVGFLLCMLLAWLPLRIALSRFVFEDSFYYLRIARSIIEGNGSSFDGIHSTNGYHPLWMIVSVLLQYPFSPGAEMPVHLLLSLCAVFHVLTAFFIYRTVLLGGDRTMAVIASLMWLFNYNVAGIAMCGLETSLFAFLTITAAYHYTVRRHDLSARQSAGSGILLGLTALARLDGALLGFAFVIDQLCLALWRRERTSRVLARVAPMSLAGSAMMVPWMIWSLHVSGTIFPNSHRALKLWIGAEERFREGYVRGLFNIFERYVPTMGKMYGVVPIFVLSLFLVILFCAFLLRGRERRAVGLPVMVFAVFPATHALYYAVNFAPLNRYLYPAHMLAFTGIMTTLGCWLSANRHRRLAKGIGLAASAVVATNIFLTSMTTWKEGTASVGTHSLHWTMYREALPWIRENVGFEEKVGAFNCGIYGYFCGRTVVNLDGVVNDSVIPVLEKERLIHYLYDERITHVIDWETMLDTAFRDLGGVPDYRQKLEVVESFEQPWGPYKGSRLLVLRLVPQRQSSGHL